MSHAYWLIALLLFPLGFFTPSSLTYAQEKGPERPVYQIKTVDGNRFVGTVVSETENDVTLDTEQLGEITIDRDNIETMDQIDPARIRDGEYRFDNPVPTRHFFSPTAIGLQKGRGYYKNTWIFFNDLNHGISDNVSLGGGTVPLFLFGAPGNPVWLLPKLSFSVPQENLHVAVGALAGTVVGEDAGGVGIVYGMSTLGDSDRNLTLGLGYGYAGRGWSQTPAFNAAGMFRLGRTTYLISENYLFSSGGNVTGLGSVGVRWAPEPVAVDFGLIRPFEDTGNLIAIPWLGVTIPFGP